MEEWRTIKDYENYQVSNLGRVRNIKTGKILKPANLKGYCRVELFKSGIGKWIFIHRLVAQAFLKTQIIILV